MVRGQKIKAVPWEARKLEKNGTAALTRLVWWAVGIGAVLVVGGGSFFATTLISGMRDDITSLSAVKDLRTERMALLEGRIATLEQTGSTALTSIDRRLQNIERWQEEMRDTIAELKASRKP
jgi:hypothetical protein